ncbi:pilus assembly PilX N-terminal domain-containing protein, partial [bacterium]|nr:pilus assembly PilX N-terminal domain-containing protein [bacterium]
MKKQNNKKGIVLVSTMLLLTVIIMTGIMLAISAYSNMKISRTYNSIARAQFMDESGTEYIRYIFYQHADFMYHKKLNDKGSVNKK